MKSVLVADAGADATVAAADASAGVDAIKRIGD
jgi:hypothetical protein